MSNFKKYSERNVITPVYSSVVNHLQAVLSYPMPTHFSYFFLIILKQITFIHFTLKHSSMYL